MNTERCKYFLRRFKVGLAFLLCAMQLGLILFSWILAAAYPELPVRSLLSSEGIRWFLGQFTDNMQTPLLVWLLLCSIAYGAVRESRIIPAVKSCLYGKYLSYRQKVALWLVLSELMLSVTVMSLLGGMPHAILLSVTGDLFPSSFSRSIIPVSAFCISVFSVTFGVVSGKQKTFNDVFNMLTIGIVYTLPLWLLYVLGIQFYCSLLFVFKDGVFVNSPVPFL